MLRSYYNGADVAGHLNYGARSVSALNEQNIANSRRHAEAMNEKREEDIRRKAEYRKFISETKDMLLTEGIFSLMISAFPEGTTMDQYKYGENIILQFVKEAGADNLLREYATKSEILSSLSTVVTSTFDRVVKETSPDSVGGFNIKTGTAKDFYSKLKDASDETINKRIVEKVSKATTEFIQQQAEDNTRIEDMAEEAKKKIDSIKGRNEDDVTAMKNEQVAIYNVAKDNIRFSRTRSVFEEMVYTLCEKAVKDDVIRESCFVSESGKLDIGKAIGTAKIMYTVLESMMTYRVKEFKPNEVLSLIQNI